jgi:hypothetical protein
MGKPHEDKFEIGYFMRTNQKWGYSWGGGPIRKVNTYKCFAPSPRRLYVEYKRMVFEHTHGLFIT